MSEQPLEILGRLRRGEAHGRGKAAQQRHHWTRRHILEHHFALARRELDDAARAFFRAGAGLARRGRKRQLVAILADEAERQRNDERLFLVLAGRRRCRLLEGERQGLGVGVIFALDGDQRRAGLLVPERELREIAAGRLGEAGEEISTVAAVPSKRSK